MKADFPSAASLSGYVLAASPQLMDPNFRETLVYVAQHDFEGALGLVMNRPVDKTLGEIVAGEQTFGDLAQVPVYKGGPVRPHNVLIAVFVKEETDDMVSCRLDVPLEQVEAHLKNGSGWVRAFAGYAGWGEGQLEDELAEDAWKICDPDETLFDEKLARGLWSVFVTGDDRWRKMLPYFPEDPSTN